MNKEKIAKAIDETALAWMTEFRNTVGGVFEDKRWHGHCAKWFKDAILPLIDETPEPKMEETLVESGTEKRGPGRPKKTW